MTYLEFHLFLTLPVTAAGLLLWGRFIGSGDPSPPQRGSLTPAAALALLCGVAFLYTLPWDHFLIRWNVWGYPPGRVMATIWEVPVEECAFFVIQTVLTGSWYVVIAGSFRADPLNAQENTTKLATRRSTTGAVAGLLVAGTGGLLLTRTSTLYLGMLLAWGGPVLALQWGVSGPLIWARRSSLRLGVGICSAYLWVADRIALSAGIWEIHSTYVTGLAPLGLPIEEALFFLITNLLIVQGLIMLADPASRLRTAPST